MVIRSDVKDQETKNRFIELRAKGWSYDRIGNPLSGRPLAGKCQEAQTFLREFFFILFLTLADF